MPYNVSPKLVYSRYANSHILKEESCLEEYFLENITLHHGLAAIWLETQERSLHFILWLTNAWLGLMSELIWPFQGDQIVNILSFPAEVSKTTEVLSFGWMMPIVPFYVCIET